MCQKVCAASQFSLVLTAGGKVTITHVYHIHLHLCTKGVFLHVYLIVIQVYSFGNGSGVGKGTTEPRQHSPWLIEPLDDEMVIDISTGDGHCLALTQSQYN